MFLKTLQSASLTVDCNNPKQKSLYWARDSVCKRQKQTNNSLHHICYEDETRRKKQDG